MNDTSTPNRCRLVLTASDVEIPADRVVAALAGGDVASLILVQRGEDAAFQAYAEAIVPVAQAGGVAVIIAGDTRIAGRVAADGIHLDASKSAIDEAVRKHAGRLIVGAGGAKTRHDALELGEAQPDYLLFGRFGYDRDPEPHPRNLDMAEWWAGIVNIPCIVQAGSAMESVAVCAATGAEFVALSAAVFDAGDPREAVAAANALLDEAAPLFEG